MDNAATALRMRNKVMMDVLNDKSLFTTDLVADIYNYEKSRAENGEASDFEKYVLENYDTSADYWKVYLNPDGSLTKIDDNRDDYYLQTKDGEFLIWDIENREDLRRDFFEQLENNNFNGYRGDKLQNEIYQSFDSYDYDDREMTPQGYMQTVNADISIDDLSYLSNNITIKFDRTSIQSDSYGEPKIPTSNYSFNATSFLDFVSYGLAYNAGQKSFVEQEKEFSDDRTYKYTLPEFYNQDDGIGGIDKFNNACLKKLKKK